MNTILTGVVAALISFSCAADEHTAREADVRDAVHAFNAAYAEDRVDDYFSYYAADASVYFYGARQDLSAYYKEWKQNIEAGGGVEDIRLSDLQVRVLPGEDTAITSYFVEYGARAPDGRVTESRAFESEVWQYVVGEWKIVHLHYSEISPEE